MFKTKLLFFTLIISDNRLDIRGNPEILDYISQLGFSVGNTINRMIDSLPPLSNGNIRLPISDIGPRLPSSVERLNTLYVDNVHNQVLDVLGHAFNQGILHLNPTITFLVDHSYFLQQSEHLLVPPLVLFTVSLINRSPRLLDYLINYSNRMGNVLSKFLASVKRTLTLNYTEPTRPNTQRIYFDFDSLIRSRIRAQSWLATIARWRDTAERNVNRLQRVINERGRPDSVTIDSFDMDTISTVLPLIDRSLGTNHRAFLWNMHHQLQAIALLLLSFALLTNDYTDYDTATITRILGELDDIYITIYELYEQLEQEIEDGYIDDYGSPQGSLRDENENY